MADMNDNQTDKAAQRRTRIFIVVFMGGALLLSLTTILGTWSQMAEHDAEDAKALAEPAAVTEPAAP